MSYIQDPRVDAYLDGLPPWQQAICQRVRDLVHAADPQVQETIKRRVQPYFVLEGNICALLAAKDHVNVFLYDGAIVPDLAFDDHLARSLLDPADPEQLTALLDRFVVLGGHLRRRRAQVR